MATDFKILRGYKDNLIDEQGKSKLPPEKLVNGYWYLTNDTAEVYVALEIDGIIQLKKINECDINNDFDFEAFDGRLTALESQEKLHTFASEALFIGRLTGEEGHMYVSIAEGTTYVWFEGAYRPIGGNVEEPEIIFGGTAD
jgi:hypothetical protein